MKLNFRQIIPHFIFLWIILFNVCRAEDLASSHTILSLHNKLRSLHQAPPLEWDDTLAYFAKQYASQCQFKHSGSRYGENLAAGYPSVTAAINAWYAEQKNYSYSHPRFSYNTGHFTQVVWKGTRKIGCGYVACNGTNGTPGNYLVCEYSPAGNIANSGYFARNVLPVGSIN